MARKVKFVVAAAIFLMLHGGVSTRAETLSANADANFGPGWFGNNDPYDIAQLTAFVKKRIGDTYGIAQICSFEYVDIDNDGSPELIASIDTSGRRFCNAVIIVQKLGNQFIDHFAGSWNTEDVTALIYDFDDDGRKEIVTAEPWSEYQGGRCVATWRTIWRLDGRKLVNVSRRFPRFFYARLNAILMQLPHVTDPSCLEMEAARLQQFLGIDSRAEFALAMRWQASADPILRSRAIDVFLEIGDAACLFQVGALANDEDPDVRFKSRFAVRTRKPK